MNCEILDLKAFLTVLDAGGFQNAALQLNMSQPTVSRRIKALETTMGVMLLQRTTRHITLTGIGATLEPSFLRIVSEFESCSFSLGGAGRQSSRVTVASIATAASTFLPRALKRFAAVYPDAHCRIIDLSAEEGIERVVQGEAEFGINFLGQSRPDLRFTPLINDDFVVVCRGDHGFAARRFIRWRDLVEHPLIISQRSGNRTLIEQALAGSDLHLNWSFEDVHLATSFGLVEAGVGLAIIPRMAGPVTTGKLLVTVPIRDPVVRRTVGLVERRIGQFSRAAAALRRVLVEEMTLHDQSSRGPAKAAPVGRTQRARR
jgi:DNA-binding transcriptional LysR family regulator